MKATWRLFSKRVDWSNFKQQREKFEAIGVELGITKWQDWYNVTKRELIAHGAGGILARYQHSNIKALTSIFPGFTLFLQFDKRSEYSWKVSSFNQVPKHFWDSKENQRVFFEQLAKELNIKSFEDWYTVKWSTFREKGAAGILMRYKDSAIHALASIYPEHKWRIWKFERVPDGFW